MATKLNSRASAAKLAWQVIDQGRSLDAALRDYFEPQSDATQPNGAVLADKAFIQELLYGICRWYGELTEISTQLLRSPIRKKDRVVHFVLLVGLYQLRHLDTPDHAAISETVSACKQLNKQWAKNLINGCLRSYQRAPTAELQNANEIAHPKWMATDIKNAWPDYAQTIFTANNQRPPMCLRVNQRAFARNAYLEKLDAAGIPARLDPFCDTGIILKQPCPVVQLPDFFEGACSVQDTAAQIAAHLLAPEKGMCVLDACAAPGGKTAHLLEQANNDLALHALDVSAPRIEQLEATLARLNLNAQVITGDGADTPSWPLPAHGYDRILIDAPCSGLGVIRRHPDIKHHRRESDIEQLVATQGKLLKNLWLTLKPGGRLLYMTCSILPAENQEQIKQFVSTQNDVMLIDMDHPNALCLKEGVQTLPGVHGMDGFYYCLLAKRPSSD